MLQQLSDGASFAQLAQDYSNCPSASKGGSLGTFVPGAMEEVFEQVIFDPKTKVGQLVGPVKTIFGYHVIVVDERTGV